MVAAEFLNCAIVGIYFTILVHIYYKDNYFNS